MTYIEFEAVGANLDALDADIKRQADLASSGRLWSVISRSRVREAESISDYGLGEPYSRTITHWVQDVRLLVDDTA